MSSLDLLLLNVDTLFEQHSVTEIEMVHKRIEEVIENKKEELRTMVGERYRDLLKAADTITAMKESTKELITQVESISGYCKNLNDQQLVGFKTETDKSINLNKRIVKLQDNYFSTMVQINLLTCLPEIIWSHLDQEQYYAATELFIFSRHISTGLQLDSNDLMRKLPIAKKQWEILKPFQKTIKQQVLFALERETLTIDVLVDCLIALLLLDHTTLENAFKCFLKLRTSTVLHCLSNDNNGRAKDRILTTLKVLNDSLELIHQCFFENGAIFVKLNEYTNVNALPTINRVNCLDVHFDNALPDIILNFKGKFDTTTLSKDSINLALEKWLKDIQDLVENQLKQLFDLIANMQIIQEIKTDANNIRKPGILRSFSNQFNHLEALDFYELHYVPLINQRIRNIINDNSSNAINEMQAFIKNLLEIEEEEELNSNKKQKEYIWQENATDLPNSLAQVLNGDLKTNNLLMKSKGYDTRIINVCHELDEKLAGIINEMNILLKESSTKVEDKILLVDFLSATAQEHLNHFINQLGNLQRSLKGRSALLFLAHCCCALLELCPHLKICLCQKSSWRQLLRASTSSVVTERWRQICSALEEQIYHIWLRIIEDVLEEFDCKRLMPQTITNDVILKDFTHWESITLEQGDYHSDHLPQTSVIVPIQPSLCLQTYFYTFILKITEVIPQTLPSKVLQILNEKLLQQLIDYYHSLLNDQLTQKVAQQIYFDLKFLQHSFELSNEQKEQFEVLQNSCKKLIDPFDFELLFTHNLNNVKKAVNRFSCLLGVLTSLNVQSVHVDATHATNMTQDKDPNILNLCSSSSTMLWFPLLPIVTNSNANNNNTNIAAPVQEHKKTSYDTDKSVTPTHKSNTAARKNDSKSKSGAVSFFGAMSQDWFR
ncbi:conserved oligomeric Golgi complex subunit 1 [Glossina fuscipes]|uniref:Conserved oligomeric Golgi complex subunit 1 n=1 Tax=Glossina fuscipes TaxID=7396 RepID=A0A9C6DYM8_9MUSC|nr:conserved oligomeric Golgi complex subunit 1 [Glossina fuscipes]